MGKPAPKPPNAKRRSGPLGQKAGDEQHGGGDFFGSEYEGHGGQPGEDSENLDGRGSPKTKPISNPNKL